MSDMGIRIQEKGSVRFKPGAMTLGDLAKSMKENEDGTFTFSFPADVVESSSQEEGGGIYSRAEMAAANQPAESGPAARAEVLAQIDEVKNLPIPGIKRRTRGMTRTAYFAPAAPAPFAAGRFQVDFEKPDGSLVGVIFQTEAGPGHLARVVPGETPISGGSISFLSNPDDSHSITSTLNKAEEKSLIEGLYGRFTQRMTSKQADQANSVISYAMAIHFRDGGQGGAVQGAHQQLAADVKAQQPGDSNSSGGGWNLR